jgi:hypothetical protein
MGWDVQLIGLFRSPKHPVSRFLEIARCFERSTYFSKIYGLTIHDEFREPVQIFDYKKGLNIEHLQQILEPYSTESCELVGWWSADERYFVDDENRQEIIRTGYRVTMQTPADEHTYNSNLAESSFIYTIGNSSLFSLGLLNEVAQLNFDAVLQEISILSELEVSTMQGVNIDSEHNPRRSFLMYHDELSAFGMDLGEQLGMLETSLNLMQEDIWQIVQGSKDVEYQAFSNGTVIFNRNLVHGNLESFYNALEKYLKAVS